MLSNTFLPYVLAAMGSVAALPTCKRRGGLPISVTPHDSFSSSVGVLGCKINTNRVAYWPSAVSCNDMCVKVSHAGRSVYLLRIDQSGGAYDISYDAWNYLSTGQSVTANPTQGGGIDATYENVDMSHCVDLITEPNGKLAFSAANSMNFIASCLAEPSSWLSQNYALYNIANSACTLGEDEVCKYLPEVSNQPQCKSMLGIQTPMASAPVYNLAYGTGAKVKAT